MSDFDPRAVADRLAIHDLLYRYCRAVDRLDAALGYAVWHADGTMDLGQGDFCGSGRDFIDWVIVQHGHMLAHSHQVTNILLDLDGDRAASESYFTVALRIERDGRIQEMRVWGRYLDRWSRRDGRWGIDARIVVRDFDDIRAVTPLSRDPRSRRDAGDASYAVFASLAGKGTE